MVQRKKCRSRQELSNEYLLAKIGVDTAENEPLSKHHGSNNLLAGEIAAPIRIHLASQINFEVGTLKIECSKIVRELFI